MYQIFKILFQTGDINIFVLCGIFFSRYVQLRSTFTDEKNISKEIWTFPLLAEVGALQSYS